MKISQSGPVQQHGFRGRLASILLVALASFASGVNAQQGGGVQLNPSHPDTYIVKSGDTLWDISARFLRDPWHWPEIWYVNPQVANPHLIYPGDVLTLVYVDGKEYVVGTFEGSCAEIGASGGVDGKGLLAGELAAAQCWFAGGGDEIGVFAHEDGGYQIMVGTLEEPIEGGAGFRGDFGIKVDGAPR